MEPLLNGFLREKRRTNSSHGPPVPPAILLPAVFQRGSGIGRRPGEAQWGKSHRFARPSSVRSLERHRRPRLRAPPPRARPLGSSSSPRRRRRLPPHAAAAPASQTVRFNFLPFLGKLAFEGVELRIEAGPIPLRFACFLFPFSSLGLSSFSSSRLPLSSVAFAAEAPRHRLRIPSGFCSGGRISRRVAPVSFPSLPSLTLQQSLRFPCC